MGILTPARALTSLTAARGQRQQRLTQQKLAEQIYSRPGGRSLLEARKLHQRPDWIRVQTLQSQALTPPHEGQSGNARTNGRTLPTTVRQRRTRSPAHHTLQPQEKLLHSYPVEENRNLQIAVSELCGVCLPPEPTDRTDASDASQRYDLRPFLHTRSGTLVSIAGGKDEAWSRELG